VPSWAQLEWQNVFRLKALGINTMEPVAFGEKGERSFIITKSLESVKRLENVIKEEKPNFIDRKILIKALASLTKKMHDNNLFHKDFYIGHIFIQRENERFKVYLIDLQRLQRHWFFKNHWRIKDLAALNYSSQNSFVDLKDRIRFMKYYLNVKNFRNCRTFADRIIKKTGKISRHTEKLLLRRDLI
jgi:heptose I phosphotransferase